MSFRKLGLTEELARAVEKLGFETPTPIQTEAIPSILEGRDVVGTAQTGTGKTAAFVLPLLQRLGQPGGKVRALILTPTRELAQQVGCSSLAARLTFQQASQVREFRFVRKEFETQAQQFSREFELVVDDARSSGDTAEVSADLANRICDARS